MAAQHYQTLGLDETATDEQVKATYKKLCMHHHPDRGGDEAKFKKIKSAYKIITTGTDAPNNEESKVLSMTIEAFEIAIQWCIKHHKKLKNIDIAEKAKEIVTEELAELSIKEKTLKDGLDDLGKISKKMTTESTINAFELLISQKTFYLNKELTRINERKQVLSKVLTELEMYKYDYDPDFNINKQPIFFGVDFA